MGIAYLLSRELQDDLRLDLARTERPETLPEHRLELSAALRF